MFLHEGRAELLFILEVWKMALSEQDVFFLSERALSNVIDQIQDQQWDQTTPDWFQTG